MDYFPVGNSKSFLQSRRKKKCIRFLAGADGGNEDAAEEGEHAENIEPSENKMDDDSKLDDDGQEDDVTDNAGISETEETVANALTQPPPLQTVTTT